MPEVQKSVLEHAPTEAQNPQVTGDTLAQNTIDFSADFEASDERETDVLRVSFVYEVKADAWKIRKRLRVTVRLPNGLSAWFCRIDGWQLSPYKPLTA